MPCSLDQPSQWAVSVLLGALAVPMGMMIRSVPDKVISKLILYIRPAQATLSWMSVAKTTTARGFDDGNSRAAGGHEECPRRAAEAYTTQKPSSIFPSPAVAHGSRILLRFLRCLLCLKLRRPITTLWMVIWLPLLHLSGHPLFAAVERVRDRRRCRPLTISISIHAGILIMYVSPSLRGRTTFWLAMFSRGVCLLVGLLLCTS